MEAGLEITFDYRDPNIEFYPDEHGRVAMVNERGFVDEIYRTYDAKRIISGCWIRASSTK
jgi:hypothetical protein